MGNRSRWTSDADDAIWKQRAEYPFDSTIKKMSVIFESKEKSMVFTKGAVERIFESCSTIILPSGETELTEEIRSQILENMEALASQGLRVLALASKQLPGSVDELKVPERSTIECDLVFRGLVGLYDPPRPETAGAVTECHASGIAVHMLTGDHPSTARAIALQVGILPSNMGAISADKAAAMVMTAGQFDKLSEDEIDALPLLPLVIARCSPTTKVNMIEALHRRGKFAAMTGDGVNDSPSLKRADVGIAMGLAGSDVAKDASDIVLTDDNFASILNAIEEGRRMFDNIQKFILHLLERPPMPLKTGVFTWEVCADMLAYGLWMASLCLSSFLLVVYGFGDGILGEGCNTSYSDQCDTVFRARATTFVSLTWFALFLAWEMVNMRRSFFRMQPKSRKYFTQWIYDVWRNPFLFWAVIAGFVTIFPVLYIPVLNHDVFKHTGISWEWGIVFVEATLFFAGIEAWKWAKRIFFRKRARKMGQTSDDLEKRAYGEFITDGSENSSEAEVPAKNNEKAGSA